VPFDGVKSFAVETETTNLIPTNFIDFSSWTKQSHIDTGLVEIDPFGEETKKYSITDNGAYNYFDINNLLGTHTDGDILTSSIYIKLNKSLSVSLRFFDVHKYYNLEAEKWYRIDNTQPYNSNPAYVAIMLVDFRHLTIEDVNGLEVCYSKPQIEEKQFASSFINGTRSSGKLIVPIEKLGFNPAIDNWVIAY